MPVLLFNEVPAPSVEGAVVIEADKEILRAPAQTITNVDGRCMTEGQFCLAVGTGMFFFKILQNSTEHTFSSIRAMYLDG